MSRSSRPRAPQWKIFDQTGLYMGSLHDPTDAAFVIANYSTGAQVRFGRSPKDAVWTEGVDGMAGESFDVAVALMFCRLEDIRLRRKKAHAATTARMKEEFAARSIAARSRPAS